MKISKKGRYAVRLMLDLSLNNSGDNVSLKDVSARQNIPLKTLEQVSAVLCKAGLVKSARGKSGGYTLTRAPKDITVYDILAVTDNLSPSKTCLLEGCDSCNKREICAVADMWDDYFTLTRDYFSSKTLEDLVLLQIRKQRD